MWLLNGDEHLLEPPRVTQVALSCWWRLSLGRFTLRAPLVNGFVGDRSVMVGMPFFGYSEPEVEPVVPQDSVIDDLRWNMETEETGNVGLHRHHLVKPSGTLIRHTTNEM